MPINQHQYSEVLPIKWTSELGADSRVRPAPEGAYLPRFGSPAGSLRSLDHWQISHLILL